MSFPLGSWVKCCTKPPRESRRGEGEGQSTRAWQRAKSEMLYPLHFSLCPLLPLCCRVADAIEARQFNRESASEFNLAQHCFQRGLFGRRVILVGQNVTWKLGHER